MSGSFLVTSTWQVYPCLFFYVYILYRVLAGLKLFHSTLHLNRINQEESSSPLPEAMAEKTLLEFSAPTVVNIHPSPILETENLEFELKRSLINMVQAIQFCGKVHEDAVHIYRTSWRLEAPSP